jgi:hypothetical protein
MEQNSCISECRATLSPGITVLLAEWTRRWFELLLLFGTALYLYRRLFYFPAIPFLLRGDQTFFWVYAQRMLYGEKVYRDFFQFTPPGTDLFYASLFRLLGTDIWVMNFAVLLLGIALCVFSFNFAKRFMRENMAGLASSVIVLIYGSRLDATHHWFSMLIVLCGVAVLLPKRTICRVSIAGAAMGAASFFTQTAGVAGMAGLLISFIWEHDSQTMPSRVILTRQALLLLAFIMTCTALYAPFIASAGWKQLWFLLVRYPQHYVVFKHQFLFPALPELMTFRAVSGFGEVVVVYLLMVVSYPLVLWYCARKQRGVSIHNYMPLVLLAMAGLCLLLEVITRINVNRLYAVATPAVILLFWALDHSGKGVRYAAVLWLIVMCLAILQTSAAHHEHRQVADLPAGKAALIAEDFEEFSWLQQHTRPGDLFFQASWLNVYPPLKLRSPAFIDGLWPTRVTLPEFVSLTISQIDEKHVKYVLWIPRWTILSSIEDLPDCYLSPFHDYLRNHYVIVHIFLNGDEVWEKTT